MYDLKFSDPALTSWALLRQTWSLMDKAAETRLGRIGLTPEKAAVLWACKEHPGPLIPAEIARYVSRESQSVTGLLNRMEEEGLIMRIPKRKGRPYTEIRSTDKGKTLCQQAIEILKSVVTETMSVLKDGDFERLNQPLRALRQQAAETLHLELTPPPSDSVRNTIPVNW